MKEAIDKRWRKEPPWTNYELPVTAKDMTKHDSRWCFGFRASSLRGANPGARESKVQG